MAEFCGVEVLRPKATWRVSAIEPWDSDLQRHAFPSFQGAAFLTGPRKHTSLAFPSRLMNHLWNKAGGEKGVVWCLILLALDIALHQRNEENELTVSHSVPTVGTCGS